MIIVLRPGATDTEINYIMDRLRGAGLSPHLSKGVERTIICVIGDERTVMNYPFEAITGIERVIPILKPYKLASFEFKQEYSVVEVNGVPIGKEDKFIVIAGPCSVENENQMRTCALAVKEVGAHILRGGAYKPRTSPYSFQGLGKEGLILLRKVADEVNLPVVSEVLDARDVEVVAEYVDILQIGARNMQNFSLLKEVGQQKKRPVLLKRGLSATIEEWLMAAEYILSEGNPNVILCERGIRTFTDFTRNTLDLAGVVVTKSLTHLPVIVDPSHGSGNWRWVIPLARASVAVGADGVMIEVHPNPKEALSDGEQSLNLLDLKRLMPQIKSVAETLNKTL